MLQTIKYDYAKVLDEYIIRDDVDSLRTFYKNLSRPTRYLSLFMAADDSAVNCVKYLLSRSDTVVNDGYVFREDNIMEHAAPISVTVCKLLSMDNVSLNDIMIARLLAQDVRTNLNVSVDLCLDKSETTSELPVISALMLSKEIRKDSNLELLVLPLLIDMSRNPSVNVNQPTIVSLTDQSRKMSMFMCSICANLVGTDELFDDMIERGKVDLTERHGLQRRTALHIAVLRGTTHVVSKLLGVMTKNEINAPTTDGHAAWNLFPNNMKRVEFFKLFIECSKVDLDEFMYILVHSIRVLSEADGSELTTKRDAIAQRVELIKLVDSVLANPRFKMCEKMYNATVQELMLLKNETMVMKLLNWPRLNARQLYTIVADGHFTKYSDWEKLDPTFRLTFLQQCLMDRETFSMRLFRKLLEYPEQRDEIWQGSENFEKHSLWLAMIKHRPDVFEILLSKTTDCGRQKWFQEEKLQNLTQLTKQYDRQFTNIVNNFTLVGKSKISVTKNGHILECRSNFC